MSIPHIEDLSACQFIKALEDILAYETKGEQFIISEKIDGANLVFGIDKVGKLYVTREHKGGKRAYSMLDFDLTGSGNVYRSAFAVLSQHVGTIHQYLGRGDAVEAEILFGRQPNAIVYGTNTIACLRMIKGDNNKEPNQDKLTAMLGGRLMLGTICSVPVTFTEDGIHTRMELQSQIWNIAAPVAVHHCNFDVPNLKKKVKSLKKWLAEDVDGRTVMDVLELNLSKIPVKERPALDTTRMKFRDRYKQRALEIKSILVQEVLHKIEPSLRDATDLQDYENLGIEGIVCWNPADGLEFKIVNKHTFTAINAFNHKARHVITRITSDKLLKPIGQILGVPAHLCTSLNRIVKCFTDKETCEQLNWRDVQYKLSSICYDTQQELLKALFEFKANWKDYQFILPSGLRIPYTTEIHNRTMLAFAEKQQELANIERKLQKTTPSDEIVWVLSQKELLALD